MWLVEVCPQASQSAIQWAPAFTEPHKGHPWPASPYLRASMQLCCCLPPGLEKEKSLLLLLCYHSCSFCLVGNNTREEQLALYPWLSFPRNGAEAFHSIMQASEWHSMEIPGAWLCPSSLGRSELATNHMLSVGFPSHCQEVSARNKARRNVN